ncbi:MAG TPA: phosphoribosyltransferase family protein [Citricoccus sp.]
MTSLTRHLATGLDRLLHAPAARAVTTAARDLAGLLLPTDCAVCGLRDGAVCPGCAAELSVALLRPFRAEDQAASLPLVSVDRAGGPLPLPVVAAGRYAGSLASAVLAFKDHGRTPVVRHLRPAVRRALTAVPALVGDPFPEPASAPVLVAPIPGSSTGFRRRGYDPVAELLTGSLPPGWIPAPGLLRAAPIRNRDPRRQRAASSHAGSASSLRRHRNAGRFRATARAAGLRGRTVVLFDDVMTTGSTLAAAWHAVAATGVEPAAAVVLAAVTAPHSTPGTVPPGVLTPGG